MIDITKHIIEYIVSKTGGASEIFVLNLIKTPMKKPGIMHTKPTIT